MRQSIYTIDEYISLQEESVQPLLEQVRRCIRDTAPYAVEKISWRIPTFWQGENIIHFAAFKKHLGIYPGDLSRIPFAERFENYRTTKGAIQFPFDRPIDIKLIEDITKWRLRAAENKGDDW